MALNSLKDLLIHNLKDMYSAEQQAIDAMPAVADKVHSPKLKKLIETHAKETLKQKDRVEKACKSLGAEATGETCKAMAGLIKETQSFLKEQADPEVFDAGVVVLLQKIEHYEIAGYGSCATYAELLGERRAYDLICETLDEEESTDKKMTRVAKDTLNQKAMA